VLVLRAFKKVMFMMFTKLRVARQHSPMSSATHAAPFEIIRAHRGLTKPESFQQANACSSQVSPMSTFFSSQIRAWSWIPLARVTTNLGPILDNPFIPRTETCRAPRSSVMMFGAARDCRPLCAAFSGPVN